MANLNYWNGSAWVPIGTGGAQGPAGIDGEGIEVFGPQPAAPTPKRKGDHWLESAAPRDDAAGVVAAPAPSPVRVSLLPDPPETVLVSYLP